jgi:protein-S-isoprenylcysteine O-methyltransferase Ste14
MISPTTSITTLWGIWLVGWVVTSRTTAKTLFEQSGTSQLSYSLFIWAGAVLLFFHPTSLSIFQRHLFPRRGWLGWTAVAFVAVGLGFASWARYHLGRLWSSRVTLKEDHAIVRTGPYGIVRHPIYTGLLLALVGSFVVEPTVAALAGFAALTAGLVIKIRQEERLLSEHFGGAYDAYRKDVRALIPYIW